MRQATEARWGNEQPPDAWSLPEEYIDFFIPFDPYYDFQRGTDCMYHRHLRPNSE